MSFHSPVKSLVVAVSLVLTPLSAAIAQQTPQSIIESWVASTEGVDFLSISHDGISHNAASGITEINNLIIQLDFSVGSSANSNGSSMAKSAGSLSYRISFPSLSFDRLQFVDGFYSARSIRADKFLLNFDISGGTASTSSNTAATYQSLSVNNPKWSGLPKLIDDINKPISKYYPLVAAIADISFDNASLGEMTMQQTTGDPAIKMDFTIGPTILGKASRGNFSSMLISGAKINVAETGGSGAVEDVSFSIGDMSIKNYNYRAMILNFAPGNVANSAIQPFTQVVGDFSYNDIKVKFPGGEFSMGKMSISDIGMRPAELFLLEEIDQLYRNSVNGGPEPNKKRIIKLAVEFYATMRMGNFELSDLKINVEGKGQGGMELYRVNDLSSEGLGEFLLQGINYSGSKGEYFNLDLFTLADISFPSLEALINLEEAGKKNDVEAIMAAIPTLGLFQLDGLEVRIPGKGEISIANYLIEMDDFIGPIPTSVNVQLEEAKIPVSLFDREQRDMLTALGFENINLSYVLQMAWQEATKVLSLISSVELQDGGIVDVDVSVGGIPREVFENPLTAQKIVTLVTVNSINISLEDQSIVDRVMKFAAAQQGVDAATLKAQLVGMLPFVLQFLDNPQFVEDLSKALKIFLESQGRISASAMPAAPVSVIQLIAVGSASPGAIIDLLNVKVKSQ